MASKSVLAHWFYPSDGKLQYKHQGKRRVIKPGLVLRVTPPLVMCINGLHASRKPLDALKYAPGPMYARVKLSGEILEDRDKLCAEVREVLWCGNAEETLRLFACWCARRALRRAWAAVNVSERFARGEATQKELATAREAAWYAAREAAWYAAGEADGEAAWAAAGEAAWAAAGDAAWDAERKAQNRKLSRMLRELGREVPDDAK